MAFAARLLPSCRRSLAPGLASLSGPRFLLAVQSRLHSQFASAALLRPPSPPGLVAPGPAGRFDAEALHGAPARSFVHAAGDIATFAPLSVASRGAAVKAKRDPERPKRPLAPWLRYLADFREKNKTMEAKQVMKAAAAEWKGLHELRKAPFQSTYEAEKKQYDEAFKAYTDSGKLAAWKRDPEKPTQPLTAYLRFAAEVRKQNPQVKMTEQSKLAATQWKALSPEAKAPYEQKAAVEAKTWKEAMEKYKASGKEAVFKEKTGRDVQDKLKAKKAAKEAQLKEKEQAAKAKAKVKAKERVAAKKALRIKARADVKKAKEAEKKTKDALLTANKPKAKAKTTAKAKAPAAKPRAKSKVSEETKASTETTGTAATGPAAAASEGSPPAPPAPPSAPPAQGSRGLDGSQGHGI